MIIEDLLWMDDVDPLGLPCGYQGILEGNDALYECEVSDVRYIRVLRTAALIIDLRTGMCTDAGWGAPADVAVLVVRMMDDCQCAWIRDVIGSWVVTNDDGKWAVDIGQIGSPGHLKIQGSGASLYVGRVPGLPRQQPDLGADAIEVIRDGWPTWQSEFTLLIEPQHANPHLIGGCFHKT